MGRLSQDLHFEGHCTGREWVTLLERGNVQSLTGGCGGCAGDINHEGGSLVGGGATHSLPGASVRCCIGY